METFTDGYCSGFRKVCIWFLCLFLMLAVPCGCAKAAEDTAPAGEETQSLDAESVMQWVIGKVSGGEVDIGDEESIRSAIAEGEQEFGVTLNETEKERIVTVLQSIDSLGLSAEEMLGQAQELYRKYGADVVNEANEIINDAVGDAVKGAAEGFFQSIIEAVKDFFKGLFS